MTVFAIDPDSWCPECKSMDAIKRRDRGLGAGIICVMTNCNYRSGVAHDACALPINEREHEKAGCHDTIK
jgi:hypothetical protein